MKGIFLIWFLTLLLIGIEESKAQEKKVKSDCPAIVTFYLCRNCGKGDESRFGTVDMVQKEDAKLEFTYKISEGWCLEDVYIWVGTSPKSIPAEKKKFSLADYPNCNPDQPRFWSKVLDLKKLKPPIDVKTDTDIVISISGKANKTAIWVVGKKIRNPETNELSMYNDWELCTRGSSATETTDPPELQLTQNLPDQPNINIPPAGRVPPPGTPPPFGKPNTPIVNEPTDNLRDTESTGPGIGVASTTPKAGPTQCKSGYAPTGPNNQCEDMDECTLNAHNCASNERCINLLGTYRCACARPFTRVLGGACKEMTCFCD